MFENKKSGSICVWKYVKKRFLFSVKLVISQYSKTHINNHNKKKN